MVTTSANLQSGMMQYSSQDGTQIEAYLSQPAAPGQYPGVIVTMEGMGLEDHMKDLARRFAEQGYIAIAPGQEPPGCADLGYGHPERDGVQGCPGH